ncbi:MAG: hypothetical protein ABJH26_07560, partial [Marinomonas sp.]
MTNAIFPPSSYRGFNPFFGKRLLDMENTSQNRGAQTPALPKSDVSAGVGIAGLLGLVFWLLFCRTYPLTAEFFDLPGPRV